MKKHLLSVSIILFASLLCAACALGENTAPERKLTLMVYMCGSNLESGYGAASADIEEMKNAGLRGNDVTVLIMTGGSEQWAAGYDPSRCLIQELGPRGTRIVWRSDAMNMGEADTLTQLLRFGKESYPADDYALILWNHGGGPMEGVCWDELFSMDRITLPELSRAISNANLGRKLSWIGFDACLMGSVEVAAALSPYASFMIASEESEPSKGWDYSFLQGIASDAGGAETGERIVNAYFSGNADSNDTLTLACLDLSKVQKVVAEMDAFFSGMDLSLSTENFNDVSGLRMRSVGFGRSVSENNNDDYDLVDLGDFANLLGAESSADLLQAIRDAVVYARSTVSSHGLSVYHPFANKAKYTEHWRDEYDSLISCPGYTSYVRHYGNILTGSTLAVWNKLYTEKKANGAFALQLTQEQRDSFSSAHLMILMISPLGDSYMLVSSAPSSIDENGLLTGSYSGRTLYAVTDGGGTAVGPLSYTLKPGIEGNIVAAVYIPEGKGLSADHLVAYTVENTETGKTPAILQTRVFDNATETFTNRLGFSEENMSRVYFWHLDRIMPSESGEGVLPGFFSWEDSPNVQTAQLSLPQEWHFEYSDEMLTGASLYAMFQITDSQQNLYCSMPVPVDNSVLSDIPLLSGSTVETDEYRIEASLQFNTSALDAGLKIQFSIHNLSDIPAKYQFRDVVLNDNRVISSHWLPYQSVIDPNDHFTVTYAVPARQTYGISDPLRSFTTVLRLFRDAGSYDYEEIPLRFDVEPTPLHAVSPAFRPMGAVTQSDVEIRLLGITPVNCGLHVALYVNNQKDEDLTFRQILFDGIGMDDTISNTVPAHSSAVIDADAMNVLWKDSFEVSMPGVYDFHDILLNHRVLQRAGLNAVSRLDLIANPDTYAYSMEVFSLRLDEPWTLEESSNDHFSISEFYDTYFVSPLSDTDIASDTLLYYSRNEYSVSLQSIFIGEGSAALTFEIENLTDRPMRADFRNAQLNHLAVGIPYTAPIFIPPHSVRYTSITVGTSRDQLGAGYGISSIQLTAVMNDLSENNFPPVSVELKTPAKLGKLNGITLISGDFSAEPVETASVKRPEWANPQAADTEARPFDLSVEVADVSQYTFRVEAPADPVRMAEVSRGWVTIVDVIDDDYLGIISHYRLEPGDEGIFSAAVPSLYLCLADDPSLVIYHSASADDGEIQYSISTNGLLYWSTVETDGFANTVSSPVTELTVTLDTFKGRADISSYEIDGELGRSQDDLSEVWLSTAEVWFEAKENGELPSITELSFNRDFDWYLSMPKFSLEGKPLKLALHALRGSGYSFLFSFERTDGSLFSLPPVSCDLLLPSDE